MQSGRWTNLLYLNMNDPLQGILSTCKMSTSSIISNQSYAAMHDTHSSTSHHLALFLFFETHLALILVRSRGFSLLSPVQLLAAAK